MQWGRAADHCLRILRVCLRAFAPSRSHFRRGRTRVRRGYVLLIVLLLLAIAGVGLAAACRTTLGRSAAASAALADLQHRWGTVSTQYTLLSNADNVLDLAEVAAGPGTPPVATLRGSFDLGAVRFDVALCDEAARANANALLAWRGRTTATGLLRDLAHAGGSRLAPHLPQAAAAAGPHHAISTTPDADDVPDDVPAGRVPPTFGTLAEVFPGAGWDDLCPLSPGSVAVNLTCWGDGRVNPRRASAAVLSAACGPLLSPPQVAALSRAGRSAGATFDVPAALAAVGVGPVDALTLSARLADGSRTQSVWVVAHDGRRAWRSWAVTDASDADHRRTFTGAW